AAGGERGGLAVRRHHASPDRPAHADAPAGRLLRRRSEDVASLARSPIEAGVDGAVVTTAEAVAEPHAQLVVEVRCKLTTLEQDLLLRQIALAQRELVRDPAEVTADIQ